MSTKAPTLAQLRAEAQRVGWGPLLENPTVEPYDTIVVFGPGWGEDIVFRSTRGRAACRRLALALALAMLQRMQSKEAASELVKQAPRGGT